MQIQNRFAGRCAKCRTQVAASAGVAHKPDGSRWTTYCTAHAPEQIVARKTISERTLTVHGEVIMPYEPANLPILKSMPGARWDKETKTWTVSLREQDRMRVLELADKLGLNVAPELRQLYPAVSIPLPDTLYPFQKTGVEWLARRERSLLADQMGLGKAQPLTTKVLTPTGWKSMGNVQVGDWVIDPTGGETTVSGVFPQGEREVFRVTFSDGSSTECCDEHLWCVTTATLKYLGHGYRVLPLEQIIEKGLTFSNGNARYYIPMVEPVEFDVQEVPLDPYLLGYLIGNGSLTSDTPRVSIPDGETRLILDGKLPLGHSLVFTGGIDYYISSVWPVSPRRANSGRLNMYFSVITIPNGNCPTNIEIRAVIKRLGIFFFS